MNESVVTMRLSKWAKWKLGCGKHLGYKSQVSFMRMTPIHGGSASLDVYAFDQECIETNSAVEQLPELHQAIVRVEYLSTCRTDREKALRVGVCKRSFIAYRAMAYKQISKYFDQDDKKHLHMMHDYGMI